MISLPPDKRLLLLYPDDEESIYLIQMIGGAFGDGLCIKRLIHAGHKASSREYSWLESRLLCKGGKYNTFGNRYEWQLCDLPQGYDHKYTYSHLGYNMNPIDFQAAIGRIKLKRLPKFIEERKKLGLFVSRIKLIVWYFWVFPANPCNRMDYKCFSLGFFGV